MDKLKIIFADLKKYQFWVLCGAVLVVSLVCWWLATSGVAEQFNKREAAIKAAFDGAQVPPNPPNRTSIDEVHKLTDVLKHGKQGVYPAWEFLYEEQKRKIPSPKVLGDRFKAEFEKLTPTGELPSKYRAIYQNFIKSYLPSLVEMVDAIRPVAPAGDAAGNPAAGGGPAAPGGPRPGAAGLARPGWLMPGAAGMARTEGEWTGIVEWNEADYMKLEDHFKWDAIPFHADGRLGSRGFVGVRGGAAGDPSDQ